MPCDEAVRSHRDITIMKFAIGGAFDEAGHDDGVKSPGDFDHPAAGRSVGDWFGDCDHLLAGEILKECVTADATFVEADDLRALLNGAAGEIGDASEVVRFVGIAGFKLGRAYA